MWGVVGVLCVVFLGGGFGGCVVMEKNSVMGRCLFFVFVLRGVVIFLHDGSTRWLVVWIMY